MKLLILILLCNFAYADEEVDFSSIEDLSEVREKNIQRIIDYKKRSVHNYTITQIEALKIKLQDISQSPTQLTFIPRGTKLITIEDDSLKYTQKDLHVRAHTLIDFEGFTYIQNNKGEIVFKTLQANTTSTKKVSNLYRGPKEFKRVENVLPTDPYDQSLKVKYDLKTNLGVSTLGVSRDLFQTNQTSANVFGIQGNLYLSRLAPWYIGLSNTFTSLSTSNETGRVSLKTLSFGPILKYSPLGSHHSIFIGAQSAFLSSVDSIDNALSTLKISQTSFEAGYDFEKKFMDKYSLLYGVSFKRSWLRAKSSQATFINPNNAFDNAICFNFGFKGDLSW